MDLPGTLDPRDVFYAIAGIGFLGLTLQPLLSGNRFVNMPLIYIVSGMVLAWIGLPVLDPMAGGLSLKVVEHATELIVIVSLVGAGLAIDARHTWANWNPVVRLLVIAMPLCIVAVALAGLLVGLPIAAALLLAASLVPTDPVLARSVQVGGPGEEETPLQIALTGEAGLNDGLAFPFVYLAISVAAYGTVLSDWGLDWMWFDFAYRVIAGAVVGYIVGALVSRFVVRWGDARAGDGWNATLTVLGATFVAYGMTEAVDGYGFLAVFVSARAGRNNTRDGKNEGYESHVHHGADQIESILLALLLLWFGMFAVGGVLDGLRWTEIALALALIFVIRPIAGRIALLAYPCPELQTNMIAFFGIRGMGSIFYIAYAQGHAPFEAMDEVWRIATITILISVLVHGFAANILLGGNMKEQQEEKPQST